MTVVFGDLRVMKDMMNGGGHQVQKETEKRGLREEWRDQMAEMEKLWRDRVEDIERVLEKQEAIR